MLSALIIVTRSSTSSPSGLSWDTILEGKLNERSKASWAPQGILCIVLQSSHGLRLVLEGYYHLRHTTEKGHGRKKLLELKQNPTVKMFMSPLWSKCHYFWLHPLSIHEYQAGWHFYFANNSHRDFPVFAVLRKLGIIQRMLTECSHQSLCRKSIWPHIISDILSHYSLAMLQFSGINIRQEEGKAKYKRWHSAIHPSLGTTICWGGIYHPINSPVCH